MNHNWYAVITAKVLLSKELTDKQKVMIALISNLMNERGYCYASNNYLAECLNCTERAVRDNIAQLDNLGVLKRVVLVDDKGEVLERALIVNSDWRINSPPPEANFPTPGSELPHPPGSKLPHNNIYINNKENRERDHPQDFWGKEALKKFTLKHCLFLASQDESWMRHNNADKSQLQTFNEILERRGETEKTLKDYKSHFANLKYRQPGLFTGSRKDKEKNPFYLLTKEQQEKYMSLPVNEADKYAEKILSGLKNSNINNK